MALSPNDRSIAGFTMAGHSLVHWFETSIPIFLVVWLATFEGGYVVLGFVVALGYAQFGLGALPAGVLTDRFGPKRLVVACLFGMSLSFVALALTTSVFGIALALFLWGVAASVYHPAGLALISTGVDERGTVFAYHGIAGNVGIALGPFVAATLLALGLEWQSVALALAVPGFLAAAYGLFADFDSAAAVDIEADAIGDDHLSLPEFLTNSKALFASAFALVFVIVTFEGLFYRGMLTYLPEILQGLPAVEGIEIAPGLEAYDIDIGFYIYVGFLVIGMAGQYAGGKATDRVPAARGLVVMFAILAALALAFVPVVGLGIGPLLVLCAVTGFFLFAIQPFYQEAVAVYTPADTRGLSYGYTYLGEFGLGSASIAVGGLVLDSATLTAFFALLSAFAMVGALVSVTLVAGITRFSRTETAVRSPDADDD